jgi:hypothetical protein
MLFFPKEIMRPVGVFPLGDLGIIIVWHKIERLIISSDKNQAHHYGFRKKISNSLFHQKKEAPHHSFRKNSGIIIMTSKTNEHFFLKK